MKKLSTLFVALLLILSSARTQELVGVHVGGGLANYLGDLRQDDFSFLQAQGVYSFGAFATFGERFTVRADMSLTHLKGDDKLTRNRYLQKRNLNFATNLFETGVMLETNILTRGEDHERKIIPYALVGASYYKFNSYTYTEKGEKQYLKELSTEGQGLAEYPDRKPYNLRQFAIPWGLGVKYYVSDYVWVGAELIYRKLFTDYLDDVSLTYVDPNILSTYRGQIAADLAFRGDELKPARPFVGAGVQRGNTKLNDSYYFMQVRLYISIPALTDGTLFGGGARSERSIRARIRCPWP